MTTKKAGTNPEEISNKASEHLLAPAYKFYANGGYKDALLVLDNLTNNYPTDPLLFSIGGDCYIALGEYERAILCYEQALKLSPKSIKLLRKKIEALVISGKLDHSLKICNEAILNINDNSDLYLSRGSIFHKQGKFESAIESYDEAIKLNPKNAEAFINKANSLENILKFNEAISCAEQAIRIKPDSSLAYFNLGVSAMQLRLFDLSMESFNKAIEIQPNTPKYEFAKATLFLLFGNFKKGWALWESRWKLDKLFSPKLDESNHQLWTGERKAKLLIWAEQGVGDQIMYSALIPDLSKICSDLVAQVEPRIVTLLNRSMGHICTFYPDNKSLPVKYDKHISLGSLCQYLRNDEKDFESSRYGFLKDDQVKTKKIRKDLLSLSKKNNKICGISWRSSNPKFGNRKSIVLKDFLGALSLDGYTYLSLQYGDTEDEIKEVKNKLNIDVISYQNVDNFNDLDGLTSLIQACDNVISVDNITCQISGALGKETHMLLAYGSNWIWMVDRIDSPWYDSITIYRQDINDTWTNVINRVNENI